MIKDADLLLSAFEATAYGVMITDAEGRILAVNRAFTEATGWREADVLGETPRVLASGRQDADFYEQMWAALLREGRWQGEIWNRRKDGVLYPDLLTIDALRDEAGETTHFVAVFADAAQHREREQRLSYLAYHDELTDLPNRTLFLDRLDRAISLARRRGAQLAVAIIDLDGFKKVNEAFGHEAGDLLLKGAAGRLKECLRDSDTVARLDGDEFGVLLPVVDGAKNAREAAERLFTALCRPFYMAGDEISLGASVGVTLFPWDGTSAADLMKSADLAMYEVKRCGKRNIAFFDNPDVPAAARKRA